MKHKSLRYFIDQGWPRDKIIFSLWVGPTHKKIILSHWSTVDQTKYLPPAAPPLPGRYGLGGGITKAGPGSPLQRTSAITPPSRTYQSPTLPLKAPPPPGSSRSSLGGELGQEDNHSAPEASPALWDSRQQCHDKPEKIEMKAEKLPRIKLRSLPTAANASQFFPLLLAVLKRYSFLGFIFQWLYSRSKIRLFLAQSKLSLNTWRNL